MFNISQAYLQEIQIYCLGCENNRKILLIEHLTENSLDPPRIFWCLFSLADTVILINIKNRNLV